MSFSEISHLAPFQPIHILLLFFCEEMCYQKSNKVWLITMFDTLNFKLATGKIVASGFLWLIIY